MAISYVGAAAAGQGNATLRTSQAATLPTGIVATDVLIFTVNRHIAADVSSTPTGLTFLRTIMDPVGTAQGGGAAHTDVYWALGNVAAPTFSSATSTRWIVNCVAYRGVDNASPILVEDGTSQTGANQSVHSAPAINNTDAAAWGVYGLNFRSVATPATITSGTGLTERLDDEVGAGNTSNLCAGVADSNGAVATGSVTWSGTSSGTTSIAVMWAAFLRPSASYQTTQFLPFF